MTVLASSELRKALLTEDLASRLVITPHASVRDHLNSGEASVDLRLGTRFRIARRSKFTEFAAGSPDIHVDDNDFFEDHYVPYGDYFVLHPRQFVLGTTLEYLRVPTTIHGYVSGRSSWGRRGLVIATAVGVHPGYAGCLTLELANLGEVPLRIVPGTRIAQLFAHRVSSVEGANDPGDASAYVGATTPGVSRAEDDQFLAAIRRAANFVKP